jgi:hypothetical protein
MRTNNTSSTKITPHTLILYCSALPASITTNLIANSILESNNLKLTQLRKLRNLRRNRLSVLAIRLLENLRMLLVPESQVRDEVVIEGIGAVGERDGLEALGICLGAAHVLARVGHGSTCADLLAEERHVGFVGGLEVGRREGREAGDEGGDGVAHGDCLGDMKFED